MFCAPGHVFGGTEGVGSRFHALRNRTSFRRFRGRRFPFSCLARPVSIPAVPRALGHVFMFCAPGLILGVAECVRSCFHVLQARTSFRRYRGRRVLFSYFALPHSFPAIPRASSLVLMFSASALVFGGTEGVESRSHIFRSRTCFGPCGGRRVPFSCFALPDMFSEVPKASGPVFIFYTPGLVIG
jgi:hypothetical protein